VSKSRRSAPQALLLFDENPITIDGFRFSARAVEAVGRPSADQWEGAFKFAEACQQASDYWIGDLLAYADSREDWRARVDQMKSVTGLAHQTLLNRTVISRAVAVDERVISPSITHSAVVAPMDPGMQRVWLERAVKEGWTVSEFKNEVRAASRRRVVEGQAVLKGMYRVIYADVPWRYRQSNSSPEHGVAAEGHYPSMSMEELMRLPVREHAMKNSVLFFWVTTPMLFEDPGPRDIIQAWGFNYASMQTWDKVLGIPGRFFQVQTEHLIVAERGDCPPDNPTPKPKSIFTERRSSEHSEKPTAVRKMIERLYSKGPFLELFAREKVEGWDAFGNDPRLWQ
jgi:N6-adenosine-specific RNA methylase IME4